METGALVHEPSMVELASWKTRCTMLGVVLLIVAGLGVYIGLSSSIDDVGAGGSAVMVTIMTVVAGAAIAVFGLRYLMLGFKGRGLRMYERAVEAEFFDRGLVLPRRRLVPLLRVEVRGTAKLTRAQAITATGHAFSLPSAVVEKADLWYLGSLGTRPVAPGGRAAKEAYQAGELAPLEKEPPTTVPYHGPAWPDPPPLPRDTDEFTLVREPSRAQARAVPPTAARVSTVAPPSPPEPRREDMLEEMPIDVPAPGARPPPEFISPPSVPSHEQAPVPEPTVPATSPPPAPSPEATPAPSPRPSSMVELRARERDIEVDEEEEELEDLPDAPPPPPSIPPPPPIHPPPPTYRSAPPGIPPVPTAPDDDDEAGEPTSIDGSGWELEAAPASPTPSAPSTPSTPPTPPSSPTPPSPPTPPTLSGPPAAPSPPPPEATAPPPPETSGWELEEVAPPPADTDGKPEKKAPAGWDWEEV